MSATLTRLYLIRAITALTWAVLLFVALAQAGTLTAGSAVPAFATALLVLYPVIDVAASVVDARAQQASGRPGNARTQWINAAISTVTAVAVLVAALDGPAPVLRVYAAWAILTGVIQLALAVNRLRRGLPGQWSMIISGAGSALVGLTFVNQATQPELSLTGVAGYAVGGAILYLISTARLRRTAITA
ncbi:hypothetical protein [Actinoplanes couchii]|uniref:Membrane protein n=1 Tax=Actinoplanes couchii TaxID=403638 RepID=A0ABQ3XEM7_9ACTN|nr:hypothetical protein [Actinoplanes couchii]MDR6319818.1 uncharacterized membrane protein HdeD (DUF308 family) [Actinoplanes couchii]GID56953.1 membrane protein [Actinoplanes couchii]